MTRKPPRKRLTDAEARLRRFQVDPVAVVEPMNQAEAERASARAELDNTPVANLISAAEVYAMVDSLGDIAAALSETDPDALGPSGSGSRRTSSGRRSATSPAGSGGCSRPGC